MGGYGFVRIAIPFFPEGAQAFAPVICVLALIAIIAGSLVAMVQTDVKRLVAYSSVAHMGAVMLGLFCLNREGLSGGMFQMLAHGISTGGLFLLVGFLYERRHTREFDQFGGIAKVMPLFCVCFVFVSLSSLALPGMNGFVGEFLIFAGAYARHPALAAFAVLGAILGAWYMLSAIRRIFFGNLTRPENQGLKDLTSRELLIMAPLLVAILWMGVSSQTFLDPMKPDVERVIAHAAPATPEGGR
jgi:NADH-quinone oxidoreductase subunit M